MRLLFFILIIISSLPTFSQKKGEYYSTEEENYYKNQKWPTKNNDKLLKLNSSYFNLAKLDSFAAFKGILKLTPFQDSAIDLLISNVSNSDSLFDVNFNGIYNSQVILLDSNKTNGYVVYHDIINYKIGIKKKGSWKRYDLGLKWNEPLHLKWYSALPLIKDKNTLQIEVALTKHNSAGDSSHVLVEDGYVLELTIDSITKDSDEDGLTDLEEYDRMLDPYNKDTDGDGLNDYEDLNPRFTSYNSEKTMLYQSIINTSDELKNTDSIFMKQNTENLIKFNDEMREFLMITNDSNLQAVYPDNKKLIILNEKEWEKYSNSYRSCCKIFDLSPLFKVDKEKDKYILHISEGEGSAKVLVSKTPKGWYYEIINFTIACP